MAHDPDATIEYDVAEPPYRQLAGILAARIRRGDWKPGRVIPSEHQLMGEYGLARVTVRKAVAVLAADGLVLTVPQRGTYVAE